MGKGWAGKRSLAKAQLEREEQGAGGSLVWELPSCRAGCGSARDMEPPSPILPPPLTSSSPTEVWLGLGRQV